MTKIEVSAAQARRFMLKRQGLLGKTPFRGREGVKRYISMVGCVQFDPVDVCGQSHELSLLAHVDGFSKALLSDMLYKERSLIDYFDKNMAIMRAEDWPCLERIREANRQTRSAKEILSVREDILKTAREKGCVSSQELPYQDKVDWYWSATNLSRAALEAMYFAGDLVIHHKDRTIKSYSRAEDILPKELLSAERPCRDKADFQMWQALRRIGAVGLLPNGASDAWLGIEDFKAENRGRIFDALAERGDIRPVHVEGIKSPLYMRKGEEALLASCEKPFTGEKRVKFLPPLDCMLWDRKLINKLFGFQYTWEIYTPASKVKYAHYTLPVIYGERFCGRVQLRCRRKEDALEMVRFWQEGDFRAGEAFWRAMEKELERHREFHGLKEVWRAEM